ncbi:mechanosensitive ion channel family protein [Flavobacterium sp. I3-2]|uniref:mechanosensitive ion channel family protein n=1 Tax=Flavobacterium sp. I3-2 TaxID=2748319 RepID=UPI0015AD1DA8|nr:mechanosensitive ion channel domain-containing protein [Flavobacterium sp. I3-2]
MRKNLFYLIITSLLISFGCFAQQDIQIDSNYIKLQNELKEFKKLRTQDSLRVEILTKEIKSILTTEEEVQNSKPTTDSTEIKKRLAEIERVKAITQGAPVVLNNDTLFKIFSRVGQYSATERATSALKKIEEIYESPFFYKDSLKVENNFNTEIITYNGKIILGINEIDALWEGVTANELATKFKDIIAEKVEQQREQNSFKFILIRIGEFLLIVIAFGFVLKMIYKLVNKGRDKITTNDNLLENGLSIKKHQIFKKQQLISFINKIFFALKIIIFIILLFSTLPIALKIFPATTGWANEIQQMILDPIKSLIDSIIAYFPKLIKIIFIIILGNYLLKLMRYFALEIGKGSIKINGFYKEWSKPTYLILKFITLVFLLIIIFPYLPGAETKSFQGISVFLGILISIGSSSAISNAVAGIVITYMRPFQLKDWIKVGNITGIVIEKNALVTRLKTINNEDITIPNSTILTGATVNYSSIGKENGLTISTIINVRYLYDEDLITKTLIEAAYKTNGITRKIPAYVFQMSLNDNNATYEINAITFEPDKMYQIKSDLIKNIHNTFKENDISLKSVQFVDIIENK